MNSLDPIIRLLQHQHSQIANQWTSEVTSAWARQYPGLINEDELRRQADIMLEQLASLFVKYNGEDAQQSVACSPVADAARAFGADCAGKGFKPTDCAQYLLALKNILARHMAQSPNAPAKSLGKCSRIVDETLDGLSLLTFETFVETRERLVAEKSQAKQEMTMPVILLWNSILLMQLVGMVDAARARLFTERLLESITRHEASVALVDLSSVPVFDTSVARHIMKAVDAAQVLGSRIVMIGVSAEANQNLTRQGVSFSNVISRTTMRAGVAEALRLVGRRIDTIAVGR